MASSSASSDRKQPNRSNAHSPHSRHRCCTHAGSTPKASHETLRTVLFASFINVQRGARSGLDHCDDARANFRPKLRPPRNDDRKIGVILHQKRQDVLALFRKVRSYNDLCILGQGFESPWGWFCGRVISRDAVPSLSA